jgi:hypothetical protein
MFAAQEVDRFAETGDREDIESLDEAGFTGVFFWEDERSLSALACFEGDGECTFDGTHGAVESEFAGDAVFVKILGGGSGREEGHSDGDGQIEGGAFFSDISGGEIDGDASDGPAQKGVRNGGGDAVATFSDCCVWESDDDDGGVAFVGVDFDIDSKSLDS